MPEPTPREPQASSDDKTRGREPRPEPKTRQAGLTQDPTMT